MEAETHANKLKGICRLCGCLLKRNKNYNCNSFRIIIYDVYGIDVNTDDNNLHPPKFCGACRLKLSRHKTTNEKLLPYNFVIHTDSCNICFGNSKGRKRKNCSETICEISAKDTDKHTPSSDKHVDVPSYSENIPSCSGVDESLSSEIGGPSSSGIFSFNNPTEFPENNGSKFTRKFMDVRRKLISDAGTKCTMEFGTNILLNSIPLDQFKEHNLASILKCTICLGVPRKSVYTTCNHIFCQECIGPWLEIRNSCPLCRSFIDETDLNSLPPQLKALFDILQVKCPYSENGCSELSTVYSVNHHSNLCQFQHKNDHASRQGRKGISFNNKVPLFSASRKYVKQKRVSSLLKTTDEFCKSHKEDKTDVLFFMLRQNLEDKKDNRANEVDNLWRGKTAMLTPEQCLALRIDTLQSKENYKSQYYFLKEKGCNTFSPPSEVDKLEKSFLPQSVRYCIESDFHGHGNIYHTPAKNQASSDLRFNAYDPINLTDCISSPEMPRPNLKGVRYNYIQAISKTLEELDPYIVSGLEEANIDPLDPSLLLKTFIKDGADGMGDVSVYWDKSDCELPNKAFRFSFAVVKVCTVLNDEELVIYEEDRPNSVRTNRPLLEAIADENHHSSSIFCMVPIEQERSFLKGKILRIHTKSGWRRHEISFFTSMIDEKFDRSESGLAGSGSKYLCTLCSATRDEAKAKLGSFNITRTYQQTRQISDYIRINPDHLSQTQIDKISLGVKQAPIICSDAIEKGIDSTHADINMASFFKKLIIREIAGVTVWEMTAHLKPLLLEAESKFDRHMRLQTGINPSLMMPGNYARTLFDSKSESIVCEQIANPEKRLAMSKVLSQFRELRKIYRAKSPKSMYPQEVRLYKANAVDMGKFILEHYSYVDWPNYLHKIIEHVQELIEHESGPGSIGMFSSEGNEGGNKVFRHFRKHLSRKGDVLGGLKDVLQLHWLYSSKTLQELSSVTHKQNRCSVCFEAGHKRNNCPNANL